MKRLSSLALALLLAASPAAIAAPADRPLPKISGLTCTPDEKIYNADTLFEIIDGAAEVFLQYGFVRMDMARYAGPAGVEVRLELYEHNSVANAFGMYSQESDPAQHFLKLGTEGYQGEGYLNFFTGRYYVKVMTDQSGPAAATALERLARAAHAKLAQKDEWPAELKLLPTEGRQPHTEQFIARSFLGRAFFNSAWVAKYTAGKDTAQVFVLEAKDAADVSRVLDEYRKAAPGGTVRGIPSTGYTVADPTLGPVELRAIGRYLAGVVNCTDEKARAGWLDEIAKRIATAKP